MLLKSPGGFKRWIKVKSRWLKKRSAGPVNTMIQFKKVEKKDGHKVKLESLTDATQDFAFKLLSKLYFHL